MWETWFRSLGWEDPWRRERLPTPVFWPEEFHGLYSPWGCKESDTTEWLSLHFCNHCRLDEDSILWLVWNVLPWDNFPCGFPSFNKQITSKIHSMEVIRADSNNHVWCMHAKSPQSCSTLCYPMDHSLPGSSVHGILPSKNTGVGCHALLQGLFPTQGLNPSPLSLLHW